MALVDEIKAQENTGGQETTQQRPSLLVQHISQHGAEGLNQGYVNYALANGGGFGATAAGVVKDTEGNLHPIYDFNRSKEEIAYAKALRRGENLDTWYAKAKNESDAAAENYKALSDKLASLNAASDRALTASPFAVATYQNAPSKEEISHLEEAVKQAEKDQQRKSDDFAAAKAYKDYRDTTRPVEEAYERGLSYSDINKSYSQSLDKLDKARAAAIEDLNRIRHGGEYIGSNPEEQSARQEADEENALARLEALERQIERVEGLQRYAKSRITSDRGAEAIIRQGEELARTAREQGVETADANRKVKNVADYLPNGAAGYTNFRNWAGLLSYLPEDGSWLASAAKAVGEAVRDLPEAYNPISFIAELGIRAGEDAQHQPQDNWTKEQKDLYNYFYGSEEYGPDIAKKYAQQLNYAINSGEVNNQTAAQYKSGLDAGGSFLSKAGKTVGGLVGAIPDMALAAGDFQNKALDIIATGDYAGHREATAHDKFSAFNRGRVEDLNRNTLSENIPVIGGKGWGDLYQLGQSSLQSLAMGNVLGEAATLGAFFVNAANSSFDEAMQRSGGNTKYASTVGLLSGAAEVIGEKLSLDHLLKGGKVGSLSFILKQAGIEGSEEVATSLMNQFFDRVASTLTGEQSFIQQQITDLVRSGMSYADAEKKVWRDTVSDVAFDFVGGAISGGFSVAVQSGVRGTQNKLWEMRKDSVLGTKGGQITNKTDAAKATDAQLEKLLVQAEKRGDLQTTLFLANELINREEAGQRQKPTGDPNSTSMLAERILDGMRRNAGIADEQQPEIPVEQAQQRTPLEIELDEQEAEMRQQQAAQNAVGQQETPAGQITQPSQQNAAQTVKPGNSEQQERGRDFPYTLDDILTRNQGKHSVKEWVDILHNAVQQNPALVDMILDSPASNFSQGNTAFGRAIKQLRAEYSGSTTSTESGTMTVPNTQEVTTNAGEQAVRTDEAAAGRPDGAVRESDVRSAGRTGSQNAGAQEATSAQQGEESRTYERSSELPGFVTEEDRTTLGTKEDSVNRDNLPPEKQTSFKRLLEQTAKGTRFITKPKIGSRVHFLQQLFKKLGVADDFLFARNDRTSVFKDGAVAKQQLGKVIIDVNSDFSVLLSKGVHDYFHKKIFDKLGGGTTQSILDGSYTKRLSLYKEVFSNALGEDRVQSLVKNAIDTIKSFDNFRYGDKYAIEYNYIVAKVIQTIQSDPRYFNAYAKPLVAEMQDARALEEFFNYIVSWDLDYVDDIQNAMGLSDEELGALRKAALDVLSSDANGIVSADDAKAITEALVEWDDLNGTFTDDDYDETDWPGFPLAEDEFEDLGDPFIPTENAYGKERQRELAATLRTLISGDAEAIGRLSTDYLNYAINYTLKKADPDLDFKEKRRTYNAIANVLSGMNIDTFGYDRNVARNESNDKNNAGFDGMMSKAPNKLFYAVSSRTQADNYEGGRRGMDTIGNLQPGQYRPTGNAADMQAVLRNAINELDRRGLNIWGKENSNRFEYDEETDDTGKQYERSDADSDYSSQYNSATYGDSKAEDDYSDEFNEGAESRESKLRTKDQRAAEKREATSALRRLREGDNWLEGTVKVSPEAKEWGRGAKKTAGQKTQGWYDINRRSSLAEREFARQRVMNARAAEDLSFEIQTMEDQADGIREEVELARRNSPAAKESLKMIDGLLEDLNNDIDDLHAIDDMFRDAVREDPNSDMTKQLAAEGTRLASEIESLRRDIDTLGKLTNESISSNNSEELHDAEKRLRKQEQKIKAKREHLKKLLDESHGGDKGGALVASRAETAFDRMPDDFIKQIIRNGYVSMDMLQDYYGNADTAYQTMYEFQERIGETGKTRVPSVHKLTGLEKTALHGILADRKKAGKITSGYGGVETSELSGDVSQYNNYGMGENVSDESQYRNETITDKERAEFAEQERQIRLNTKGYPLDKNAKTKTGVEKQAVSNEVRQRNRETYQNTMAPAGMVYEPSSGPVAANMDRLNRMFADRLGIKNKGNTAIAYGKRVDAGTWEDDSGVLDITENANAKEEKEPLVVDAAYTNYAAAAQSVADLHKKILSDIMAEHPNAEPDFIDKQIEDSFLGNSVRALDTAVSQIANSKDPLGAVFNLRQQLYSAKNKGEGTYAALTSDAVIGMCDEIGRLIENKTMPYDKKAEAYAVATTQLVSALSTRAERLYDAAHRVQRIQDKLATVTKKDRGSLRQLGTGYLIKQMNPTTLFKMLDDFDVSGKGAGYEIARALENGTVKSAELIARAARQFDEAKKTEGFQEFAEGKTIAKYKLKGEYTISELQAVEFIMLARRMNGMKVYDVDAHGGVIEKTRLQTLKGFALRDADGNHIFVDSMYEDSRGKRKRFDWYKEAESMYRNLSPAAKAYMKAANKVLGGLGKEIRQTKINATGVGFSGMEGTGYYPMSYMSQKEHLPDYNTSPDYEGLSQDKHLQSVRLTHGGYAVVQNAAKTVDRYVEWASNYAAYGDIADMLLTMNTSGNGRGIVNATGDAYGAQYAKAIEKYIGDINNFTDTQKNDVVNSALRDLRQKMAAGALGLSLSVPIKQVASYWDAAGILSMDSLRRAYRFKLAHEKGLGADNMFLQSRKVGNIDPTVSEMLGSGLLDSLKKRSGIIKRFAEATNTMDYRTVDNLFTATVLDVEASLPGIDKDSDLFKRAVEAKFNQVVLNTQPIFNKNARSEYQRSSNEIERALGMFRTQQTQNLNRIITSVMEARSTKGTSLEAATKRQLRQTLAGQIAGQLEFAALTAIANTVMHGWKRWRDDDDEITMESIIKRFGLDFAESIAGTMWFGDEAAKFIADRVFGTNESFGVSVGALSTLADTGKYFFDIVDDLKSDDPLALFDSLRKFVGSAATVAGVPANNVYRLANSAVMWGADVLKWASKGKHGNRANYDDSMKMLDAWIKGGLKEEGAKKQAAKAFRKGQPENLLYNLGILSSLTEEDGQDKGRNYLDSLIKKSGDSDDEESKNHRIVDYLVHQSVSADKIDKAVDQYGTSYQYNQFYDILRQNGHSPVQAVKKLDEIDTNGDSKITTDELQDYWKKHGHEPKENKLIEALFGPTADDFRIIKDTKTFESSTRYYKPVIDSGVTAERAVEIVDGCRSESGDVTQAGIYQYYLAHPEDIKQIQALYNSMGYKEKGQPRTWESFLKTQAKNAAKNAS